MRELIIGIFLALLMFGFSFIDFFKSLRKFIAIESIAIFVTTLFVCLVLKRPDVLRNTLFLVIVWIGLMDFIIQKFKKS